MKTVCELNQCAGCMACVDICPKGAIRIEDTLSAYNAVIDEDKCINCNACYNICQNNNPVKYMSPIKWYQGWAQDKCIRSNCASGGFATAISIAFIKEGGYVYSCSFCKGEFRFKRAVKESDVISFAGSKYVKSNPSGCYRAIREDLNAGKRVLFIGLPCQVAAIKKIVGNNPNNYLYTIDLICHGTPSPKILNLFLKQYRKSIESFESILFRVKAKVQIPGGSKGIVTKGVSDRYTIAFLNSLTYTENCYECKYAQRKRVSDITLGDSWGSELPLEEQKNGLSLALCQTEKGIELLKAAEVVLKTVDLEKAIRNNHQLEHPSIMPITRKKFFDDIMKGKKFNSCVYKCFPKQCIRQNIKELLIHLKMIPIGGIKSTIDYGLQYVEGHDGKYK